MARGQTIASLDDIDLSGLPQPKQAKALRYWFDDNDGRVTIFTQLKESQTLDVSALIDGLHTLHYQVIDENDDVADIQSSLFMKVNGNAIDVTAKQLQYWFDDDTSTQKTITAANGTQILDASHLLDGLHTVHYQVIGRDNAACHIVSALFMKMGSAGGNTVTAKKLMYWFDDESTVTTVDVSSGIQMLDASTLLDGLHTIHYQVLCSNGALTPAQSSLFMRMNFDTSSTVTKQLRYWFDDAQTANVTDVLSGSTMLDASALVEGLHTVHYQIVDSKGLLGAPASSVFMKMDAATSTQAKKLRYWFDDDTSSVKVVNLVQGTQTLDVNNLLTGLHTLSYQLIDTEGKVGTPYTRIFMKAFDKAVANGQNRVNSYQYWLNANSQAMKTVALPNAANPYQLISLLPMQKEPIHSDCFHFEMTNGHPTIYAKNVFHIRFHDAAGYFSDEHRPFIDYSVKQEVTATTLDRLNTNTINVPGVDQIHWFCFEAELGDTTAFKASQATSIQVFDPDGKEVYSAQGSESVKYGGCHTWKEGMYYVALHDVTGSKPTISLDFMHLAKYDVVRQDVNVVGNGGVSTITFDGNGFKDLYAVSLYNAQGDSIKAEAIGLQNDAVVSITFDFTDARLGVYDAVFHFTEESKKFKNIATVEVAKGIELALDVKYPSTFLRGNSTTYTITVTNKGNSTAYDVPVEIYLSAGDSISNISSVKFKDENGKQFNYLTLDNIEEEKDSIDEEFLNFTEELLKELNGLQTFVIVNDSTDGGEYGITNLYFTISPNSSTTFHIEIRSSETVEMNVKIPSEWFTIHSEIDVAEARMNRKKSLFADHICCQKEKVECTSEFISNLAGFLPGYAGCIASLGDNFVYYAFEFGCAEGDNFGERWNSFRRNMSNNSNKNWSKLWNTILNCATAGLGEWVKGMKNELKKYEGIRDKSWQNMEHYRGQANINRKLSESAWKKYNDARNSGDMDLAKTLKNQAQEFEVDAAEYEKLADGAYGSWLEYTSKAANLETEIGKPRDGLLDFLDNIKNGIESWVSGSECVKAWMKNNSDCPPNPKNGGGSSTPVNSCEPNDMLGYVAESGCKAIKEGQTDVWYTIQFENDTIFADAPAHDIYLTDTLDVNLFDLSTYRPTKITIGEKSMKLTGERNFISTMDMRPEISAIAQIEGTIDDKTGIVRWHISSLDPMTMEPIKDALVGVLPPNFDGSGMGEASFDISLKKNLSHGTEIPNRSGNIFDSNETVMTPYWTNVIDRIAPESYVADVKMATDTTAAVRIAATDELSGPWRYNVYVQYGDGAWFLGAENVPIDKVANVKVYEGIDHGFYTIVTDSAGNVEQKEAAREFTLEVFGSLVETNTQLALAEGWNWISHNQQEALSAETLKPKAQRIVSQTEELYKDSHFGWSGDLDELLPTEMYKVQMTEAEQVQLSGLLFNAAFRSVPLREGWNWIGYPVNKTMTPTEALAKLEAEEGDVLIGQDGMAQYNDGQWRGTLMELNPGHGYLYRSVSDKNLFLNATAQSSSRRAFVQRRKASDQYPEVWQTDKRKYPNVMGTVIRLCKDGVAINTDEWLVGAFCGDECRGVAEPVSDVLMMNVYGRGNEQIVFRVIHRESGELVGVSGQEAFRTDLLGTMQKPYELNIGQLTGIKEIDNLRIDDPQSIYDLQGRKIENGQSVNGKLNRGVYIVTDGNNSQTQKVVTK